MYKRIFDSEWNFKDTNTKEISKAKTIKFNISKIETCLHKIHLLPLRFQPEKVINTNFSRISNHSFWYSEDILFKLSYISQIINLFDFDIQLFFKIALSEVVREVSYTRNCEFKRFRMPSKNSPTNQIGIKSSTMNNEFIVIMKKVS